MMKTKIDHLETIISGFDAKFSNLCEKVDDLIANKNMKEDIDAQVQSASCEIKELVEVTNIHKLKLDVFNEEFFAYSKIVDGLEVKVTQFDNKLALILHRGFSPTTSISYTQMPTPPTPPSSLTKKS